MSKPVQLKESINSLLKNIKKNNKVSLGDLEELFKKNIDKRVLSHIKFVNLKDGVLKLKADSSPWVCELNLRKPQILEILKNNFPNEIADVKIFIGEIND